jgi:hypothetical protein
MSIARKVAVTLSVFVYLPMWLYLIYQIMLRVQATELMWFLFWIYVPVSILTAALTRLTEGEKG